MLHRSVRRPRAIRYTTVCSLLYTGTSGTFSFRSIPVQNTTLLAIPRCVTGIMAAAGPASAEEIPGMTLGSIPKRRKATTCVDMGWLAACILHACLVLYTLYMYIQTYMHGWENSVDMCVCVCVFAHVFSLFSAFGYAWVCKRACMLCDVFLHAHLLRNTCTHTHIYTTYLLSSTTENEGVADLQSHNLLAFHECFEAPSVGTHSCIRNQTRDWTCHSG